MMMDDNECGAIGEMLGRGNQSTWRKPAPVCYVYHKSHMPDLGFNLDHHGGKPVTNRLSYGTAKSTLISSILLP
jgi:hypothetical protein